MTKYFAQGEAEAAPKGRSSLPPPSLSPRFTLSQPVLPEPEPWARALEGTQPGRWGREGSVDRRGLEAWHVAAAHLGSCAVAGGLEPWEPSARLPPIQLIFGKCSECWSATLSKTKSSPPGAHSPARDTLLRQTNLHKILCTGVKCYKGKKSREKIQKVLAGRGTTLGHSWAEI